MSVPLPVTVDYASGSPPANITETLSEGGNSSVSYPNPGCDGSTRGVQFNAVRETDPAGIGFASHHITLTNARSAGQTLRVTADYKVTAETGSGAQDIIRVGPGAATNCNVGLDTTPSGSNPALYRFVITANNVQTFTAYKWALGTKVNLQYDWYGGTGTAGKHKLTIDGTVEANDPDCNTMSQGDVARVGWRAACANSAGALLTAQMDNITVAETNGFLVGKPWYILLKKSKG